MIKHKRGDVREDGMVFWGNERLNPKWLTKELFLFYKEKTRRTSILYRARNAEKIKAAKARYSKENAAAISAYNKERYQKNKHRILAQQAEYAKKIILQMSPNKLLFRRIRSRVCRVFARKGKSEKAFSLSALGCSIEYARMHLEKQFVDGMGWHNRSEWHIDHIIPLSSAHDEYSLMMLCHFTNLRPLWKADNLRKSSSWNPPEYCI